MVSPSPSSPPALEAKSRQATVIAITSVDHAAKTPRDFPARHPGRDNLYEIADLVIDNHVPHGDAVVNVPGVATKMGPVSTLLVSFCVQWLVMETAALLVRQGLPAPVWQSANVPGGDVYNTDLLARYLPRIKSL